MFIQIMGYIIILAEIVGVGAYIPQFIHLIKVKNSAGISLAAWWLWTFCNSIYLVYSIGLHDIYLIISFGIGLLANVTMVFFIYKYKQK